MWILSNTGERVDFNFVRNAGFARTFTHKTNGVVTNIASYTFAAQIRTSAGALVTTFTITTVNAAQGTFSVALSAAQTAGLTAGQTYVWSLEQTVNSLTSELLRGYVQVVLDEVTA
jgi:endoglucanase Acf2